MSTNALEGSIERTLKVYQNQLLLWNKLMEVNYHFLENFHIPDIEGTLMTFNNDPSFSRLCGTFLPTFESAFYKPLENDSKKRRRNKNDADDDSASKRQKRDITEDVLKNTSQSQPGLVSPYRLPKSTLKQEKHILLDSSDEIKPPVSLKDKFDAAWQSSPTKPLKVGLLDPQKIGKENNDVHVRFDDDIKLATPKPAVTGTQTPRSILKVKSLVKQKPQVFVRDDKGSILCAPLSARPDINSTKVKPYSPPSSPSNLKGQAKSPHARLVDIGRQESKNCSPPKPRIMTPVSSSELLKKPQNEISNIVASTKKNPVETTTPKDKFVLNEMMNFNNGEKPNTTQAIATSQLEFNSPKVKAKLINTSPVKSPPRAGLFKSPAPSVPKTKSPLLNSPFSPVVKSSGSIMNLPAPESCAPVNDSSYRSPTLAERFSLSSPVLRRPTTTPKYSSVSESPQSGKECAISDYFFNSEDVSSDSDEEKELRYWCRKDNLKDILKRQQFIDPDAIFGLPNTTCDLEVIFGKYRNHYQRSDRLSGVWSFEDKETDEDDS